MKVDWLVYRGLLDYADADCLHILDTCYSTTAAIDGNNELLAAASMEGQASADLDVCFTKVLINELEHFGAAGTPVSVAQTHGNLVREAMNNRLDATPIHAQLSNSMISSIVLQRVLNTQSSTPVSTRHIPTKERVLLSVSLQEGAPLLNREQWERWLKNNLPSLIQHVEISLEGTFESSSSVILFTLPLSLWSVIRDNEAYRFVTLVKSSNQLVVNQASVQGAQSSPEKKEILPFRGEGGARGSKG